MAHTADACGAIPQEDHEYHVILGASLLREGGRGDEGDEDAEVSLTEYTSDKRHPTTAAAARETKTKSSAPQEVCASFRYEFQPASIDRSMPGLVTMDDSSGLHVLMSHSSGTPGGIAFKGKTIENKDTDCVLIFDGTCFRLEKFPLSCAQLRHVRAPPARRPANDTARGENASGSATPSAAATSTTATSTATSTATIAAAVTTTTASAASSPRGKGKGRGGKKIAEPRAKSTGRGAKAKKPTSTMRKLRKQANAASK
ncbi:Protein associated with transcriptional elongation factor ell, partial [Globisporangium splendens]